MYVQTNQPYSNRIQIVLTPFIGPFVQDGPLGDFDPRRDLQVYVDGVLQVIQSFSYDAINNRYLLFMQNSINLQGVVQIVYHVASPSFQGQVLAPVAATTSAGSVLGWIAHTNYSLGQTIVDSNGNIQTVGGVIGGNETGTSGASTPAWPAVNGGTVSDNNLIWVTGISQQTVTGFGAFDQSSQDWGTATPLTTSTLAPSNQSTLAILAASDGGVSVASGWTDFGAPAGVPSGLLQLASFSTPAAISASTTVTTRWSDNLLLFGGSGVPLTATVTSVQVAANILTLTCAAPTYIVGTTLAFSGFVGAGFLNGQNVVILTNSGTHITAAFTHAPYGPTADSGTATYHPYLQFVNINGLVTTSGTYSNVFPHPVQAGSTILVTVVTGDNNANAQISAVTDTYSGSYTIFYSVSQGGLPANRASSAVAFSQNTHGGTTTVAVTLTGVSAAGGSLSFFAFELPVGAAVPYPEVPWVPGTPPSASVTVNKPPTIHSPSIVQSTTVSTASSGGFCSGAFQHPPTLGNTLAVFVYSDSTDNTVTISDTYFNTYARRIFAIDGTDAIFAYTAAANRSGTFTLTSVATAAGGHTVYTGTGLFSGMSGTATITGFTNLANNGIFSISSSSPTTLTLVNASGVAETHAGTASVPIIVGVNHGSNTRILIGLAELTSTTGYGSSATNKMSTIGLVNSGNFDTTQVNEYALGFAAPAAGVPGYTANINWPILTSGTSAIVSRPEPTVTLGSYPGITFTSAPTGLGSASSFTNPMTPTLPGWVNAAVHNVGDRIIDSNGNLQICSTPGQSNNLGSPPTWATQLGHNSVDANAVGASQVIWTMGGPGNVINIGDVITSGFNIQGTGTVTSVVDTLGNTWLPVAPSETITGTPFGTWTYQLWYTVSTSSLANANGYNITVHFAGSTTLNQWDIGGIAGIGAVDVSVAQFAQNSNTTGFIQPGPLTFSTFEFILGWYFANGAGTPSIPSNAIAIAGHTGGEASQTYYTIVPPGTYNPTLNIQTTGGGNTRGGIVGQRGFLLPYDAALIDVNTIIVFDQATEAAGVVPDNPAVTQVTTPLLTPSTSNEWALLLVGQGDSSTTPNGSWATWEGGQHYNQILTSTAPIQGDLEWHPAPYSGGGADPTAWAMILLLFELNGGVAPTDIGRFGISGAGGSGTTATFPTSAGNTFMVINVANSPGGIGSWTVTDSQGNAYQHFTARASGTHGNTQTLDVWIAQNIVGGSNVVTFTLSGGLAENWSINGHELVAAYSFRMSAMTFLGQPLAGTGPFSQTLTVSGFDYAVPSDATVTGMELIITGSQSEAQFSSYLTVSPASPVLDSPPVYPFQLPLTSGDVTIGTPTTTFGFTLTPAFVNTPSNLVFNVQAADTAGNNVSFDITNAQLKVYYSELGVVSSAVLTGFALIGSYTTTGDGTLPPQAVLSINPASSPTATAVTLNWNTTNVVYIRITAADSFDTGMLLVSGGAGSYVVPATESFLGTAGSVTFQMTCYDANENPVNVNGSNSPNVMAALYLT